MSKVKKFSKSYIRSNWSSITNRVKNGEVIVVSDRGEPSVAIVSTDLILTDMIDTKPSLSHPAIGMFRDRNDMNDSVAWVNKIRSEKYKKMYGK